MEYQLIENKIDISEEEDNVSLENGVDRNLSDNRNTVININDDLQSETSHEIESSKTEKPRVGFFKQFLLKKVYTRGLIGYVLLFIMNIVYGLLFGKYLENTQNTNEESINELTKQHPFLMISYACILGPMIEEFVFRKLMFGFINKYSKILAYLVSGFFFAFGHFGFSFNTLFNEMWFFPEYFLAATILAYTYDYDGYILASMVSHILYNSSMVVLGLLIQDEL